MSYFTGASQKYKQSLQNTEHKGSEGELPALRARSRWMVQNNGYATSALIKSVTNWVGRGITGKWSNATLQRYWEQFIASPTLDGTGTFASYQTLLAMAVFTDGEMFTRIHYENEDAEIPFSIEAIGARYCPVNDELSALDNDTSRQGINYAKRTNRPVRYRFQRYWNDEKSRYTFLEHKLISTPASRVIHTFEKRFPDQKRGLPILAPAILPLWELQDLTDATITKQQAAQAVGWIVETAPQSPVFPALGTAVTAPPAGSGVLQHGWGVKASDGVGQAASMPRLEAITPGGVHYLKSGEKIVFADTQDIGRNLQVLIRHLLRKLAAACGLMYEQLTGDLTEVNYSSIRAGRIDFLARTESMVEQVIIGEGLQRIADAFKATAENWLNTSFKDATISWTRPRSYGIDPLKDVKADIMELEGEKPLATWEDKIRERGKDFKTHIKQLREEQNYVSTSTAKTDSSKSVGESKTE